MTKAFHGSPNDRKIIFPRPTTNPPSLTRPSSVHATSLHRARSLQRFPMKNGVLPEQIRAHGAPRKCWPVRLCAGRGQGGRSATSWNNQVPLPPPRRRSTCAPLCSEAIQPLRHSLESWKMSNGSTLFHRIEIRKLKYTSGESPNRTTSRRPPRSRYPLA